MTISYRLKLSICLFIGCSRAVKTDRTVGGVSATWLLDVQLARADAVDELGRLGGGAVAVNQQVLVEVSDPASSLHFGVRLHLCSLLLPSPRGVVVHQVPQRAAVCSLGDRRELVRARLLIPGHWTDGDRWRA